MRRVGSWPVLLVLLAGFLAAFAWLRSRSTFLAIERDRAAAAAVAAESGVPVADAMALRDLVGADAPAARWRAAAARFAAERAHLGDPLAAVVATADAETASAAMAARAAAPDAHAAWARFAVGIRAEAGLRFLSVRERFADREHPRD
ncbi:MAG: hypothetical protein JNK78_08380 [Planctomycetes bacterium]|nr:hypothetical protein [Planctomycetota bacterium]